jgi:imidazolonepropionase
MPTVIGLAARLYGFGVLETLGMATLNAAWVLDLAHERGSIELGKRADLLVLDGPVDSIAYRFGRDPVQLALIDGRPVYVRDEAAAARLSYREAA